MVLFKKLAIPSCHSFVMLKFLLLHMTELQMTLLLTLSLEKYKIYFVFDNLKTKITSRHILVFIMKWKAKVHRK